MTGIEALLILAMAALDLAVVARRIWANQFMPNAQFDSRSLKQRRQITLTAGKPVGKLKTVVCLNTLNPDAAACIPRRQFAKEVRRGVSGLLRISSKETHTTELVNGGVLEQAKLRIRNALTWHNLHIHPDE